MGEEVGPEGLSVGFALGFAVTMKGAAEGPGDKEQVTLDKAREQTHSLPGDGTCAYCSHTKALDAVHRSLLHCPPHTLLRNTQVRVLSPPGWGRCQL